jgi:hypothetical protein
MQLVRDWRIDPKFTLRPDEQLNLTGSLNNTGNVRSLFTLSPVISILEADANVIHLLHSCSGSSLTSISTLLSVVENIPLGLDSGGRMVSFCGTRILMEASWTLPRAPRTCNEVKGFGIHPIRSFRGCGRILMLMQDYFWSS